MGVSECLCAVNAISFWCSSLSSWHLPSLYFYLGVVGVDERPTQHRHIRLPRCDHLDREEGREKSKRGQNTIGGKELKGS